MTVGQLYQLFQSHPLVTTDSRRVLPGAMFFALKGENFDGNRFAVSALSAGAACAVVDDPAVVADERFILTGDVLKTLQDLAAYHRRNLNLPIVAITGTNGKTTTKELIAAILAKKYRVGYTRENLNNHIGVPLTLLSMTPETEIGIVEMGANHPGEIDFLCRIANPDFGLITNVGKAHLEGFGSFEGVLKTKSELYRYLEEKGGTIFINGENPILRAAAGEGLEKVWYGKGEDGLVCGEATGSLPFLGVKARIGHAGMTVETRLAGGYNLENVLAAMAVGSYFQVSPEEIKSAVEGYIPSNNRSQWISTGSNEIIMDAYNANPGSMTASIRNFLEIPHLRKLFILGDMLELGAASKEEHQRIVNLLAENVKEGVWLTGTSFDATSRPPGFLSFPETTSLADYIRANPPSESLILIKGSRGMQLEKLVSLLS
ncbi:MAG: UDP-N-acetylmuramoyl-tripeptide--D-alanyl-D-alanine ligase [Prolixibacteraceae bacterium]|jgi:UDP-N-acetylmuramoyl-tripeptide--D-alanyl-D-alanine ligase|nr:UDP-N-acetylmuramoyl-tripeptide--D-alanyl-D-alanine ligase [Bacteroidales bacterium]HNZ70055.1 UDP-N-acetylmuramoyl-tripeptide--D-alanyl-D-alanine ligase [Prolixibacteraceae bacterium]HOC87348.1 UDP-N-acetylmuramoyl-tripeptide--D-alanyl-D-alanine ligase [Prolixibacteraceae bacterium]HOG96431.1 UDP-N-acetylmuramoyl-tripeptide--D-alanyl-D-alanine ligase [Prolixibacteraceae bacterium]HOY93505.1 UDP-N-acetylmuramoyl-tripeptide--D-alanyl-D-alanine ligase [Prolixibacteraceae bacterium]